MLSKPLIYTALGFQIIGIVWDAYYHFTDTAGIGEFFAAAHWPIFMGFVILLIAVLQSRTPKEEAKEEAENPNKNNPHLP